MNPGVPHYNFKTSPDENLALNEYYFCMRLFWTLFKIEEQY